MLVGQRLFFNHYFQMHEDWIKDEFKDLFLGDKRLNNSFIKTMTLFSERPEDCINRAISDAAAKKAAYRLFSNADCGTDKILKCHTDQTKLRMRDYRVVLSIHDSSYFGYTSKPSIDGLSVDIGKTLLLLRMVFPWVFKGQSFGAALTKLPGIKKVNDGANYLIRPKICMMKIRR